MDAGDRDAGCAPVGAIVREFFFLERAERSAVAMAPAQRVIAAAYVRAAERRLHLLPSFSEPRTAVVGVTLLREAVALLIRAYVAAQTSDIDREQASQVCPADELERMFERAPSPPEGWKWTVQALATSDPLYFDRLHDDDLRSVAEKLQAITSWIRPRIETRSTTNIRGTRWGRVTALVLLALLPVRSLLAHVDAAMHPNLALHMPVRQSSSLAGSAPSSALVDGETLGSRGPEVAHCNIVHTTTEAAPWVLIDLQSARSLREVRVYNRVDHHFDDGLPYVLEFSEDGITFHTVARRTTHFGATTFDPPWITTVRGQRARFVRIRCEHFLALSEVEVF